MAGFHPSDGFGNAYLDLLDVIRRLEDFPDLRFQSLDGFENIIRAAQEGWTHLFDKPTRNQQSRKISVDEVDYSINDDFKQETIQLADELDLDELQAARMILFAQTGAEALGRSRYETCVIEFHSQRKDLLGCLRLCLKLSMDTDGDDATLSPMRRLADLVAQQSRETSFASSCLLAMTHIRTWCSSITTKIQSASVLGMQQLASQIDILTFQQTSLSLQHEELGAILCYLVKTGHTDYSLFQALLKLVKKTDRYDHLLVHYFPSLLASISRFGSADSSLSSAEAKPLHEQIVSPSDSDAWALRYVHAATIACWLSEYSGRFAETQDHTSAPGVNLETEVALHAKLFSQALADGAFDFILSLCADVKPLEWQDPVRATLRHWLQRKAPAVAPSATAFSDYFRVLLMERFELFIDALITNLPGSLRRLRVNEDQQRLRLLAVDPMQQELDLEKFILIISYTFEDRPEAARSFWSDSESNLFGFLQWSSKRLSTPRACVFAEMLITLSEGEENATSAHQFLLNESAVSAGKIRKSQSLSWMQILQDLDHFASDRRESTPPPYWLVSRTHKSRTDEAGGEPETYNMLESYLRLCARLAGGSAAARNWLLKCAPYRFLNFLFRWCDISVPSRLRACAFDGMRALLRDKTPELQNEFWRLLDLWSFDRAPVQSNHPRFANGAGPRARTPPDAVFDMVVQGAEETNAFVALLVELVTPCSGDGLVSDGLPFPELLGAAHRMPGIEPYVDFVLSRVFAVMPSQISDEFLQQLLRISCLDFILICLTSFNENLIIFANASNVAVDSAMRATSLATYAQLHPFGRVMDWLFNDRVLRELFVTAHQDPEEVNQAPASSLPVQGVLRSVAVMNVVLAMQCTYLDVVRPLLKIESASRDGTVANPGIASFDDAVLDHLELIVDLGLYSTTAHLELVTSSLALLERLATSSKLNTAVSLGRGLVQGQNRLVGIFEMMGESERIARSMVFHMSLDARELAQGPGSPEHVIKTSILKFLRCCLDAMPEQANLAHLFLGFSCKGGTIEVTPDSLFATNKSLFHALVDIICQLSDTESSSFQSWLLNIKQLGLEVLRILWTSSLSAVYTMAELRSGDFLRKLLVTARVITSDTLYDDRSILHPEFLLTSSAHCCAIFLRQRSILLEYMATELRAVSDLQAPTLKRHVLSSILGIKEAENGGQVNTASILDLFDFADLELDTEVLRPPLKYFSGLDFDVCLKAGLGPPIYDLQSLEQLLYLQQSEIQNKGQLSARDTEAVQLEVFDILRYVHAYNHQGTLRHMKLENFTAWTRLVMLIMDIGGIEAELKAGLLAQTLQLILPKLDMYSKLGSPEALRLARLSNVLLSNAGLGSSAVGRGAIDETVAERFSHLFRVSLRGIYSPATTSELRELFYANCHRYIVGVWGGSNVSKVLKWNAARIIVAAGEQLIDVVCDDAYSAIGSCKVSAMLCLDALVLSAQDEKSSSVLESLVRLNFLGLMVDSIKLMPNELREAAAEDIDNPEALRRYYDLLGSVLRIITSVVMNRGPDNQQTIAEVRRFLTENRSSIVTVFKRHAKIGGSQAGRSGDLSELVRHFVLLISAAEFLDFEDRTSVKPASSRFFS
ncbi:MAG: hypothetical protein M1826_005597 [Phylliscum demangeonii]|nr:MAG: hypothetical protein M1826_005597 [Phylliscum demangeonii]